MKALLLLLFIFSVVNTNGNPVEKQEKEFSELTDDNRQKLEAWVGSYMGRNVFFIDGEQVAPIMYSSTEQGRNTWADPTKKSIEEFTAVGYDIVQTDLWFKYSLNPDGTFDMKGIQKQLAGILAINPKVKLVVRINVSAPQWWLEQNPNQLCKVTKENSQNVFSGNTAESLASVKYQEFAKKYLKLFLQEVEKIPESDRIIGIHIGGGVYGEWHYYGIYEEPDASGAMQKKFIDFARNKYKTLNEINVVWKTNFQSLDEITVPSYARRYTPTDGDFRDPQKDKYIIDYYECQQKTVGRLVNDLARLTKDTWSRRVIVGVFYGYFYGGWTVGTQASQADIQTIFQSPYIDYFAGPYASRSMNGSGIYRSLAKSVALHGKIWFTEHDGGTFLGSSGSGKAKFPDIPEDELQSIARMRRNYMYSITENGGQWWYDFGPRSQGGGWWSTSNMLKEAKNLLSLSNRLLHKRYVEESDVLIVYDMNSFNYVLPAKVDNLTPKITEQMSDTFLGTACSFDRIFLMDLTRVDLSKYKVVVFANTFMLNENEREYIKNNVMKDGRTILFMSGAGYSNGIANSTEFISDLVGINIEKSEVVSSQMEVHINDQKFLVDAPKITSVFRINDKDALAIGFYRNGDSGAAVKKGGNCNVYYFGIPLGNDLNLYKEILSEAKVRCYVENTVPQDYISVGGGIIGIYSVKGGEKTIKPLNGEKINVFMNPYSTIYFDIQNGKDLINN